jgi:hypothetical protein
MQVGIARPVVKSSACLTAITLAIKDHIDAAKAMIPPTKGTNEKKQRTPGEFEKPMVGMAWVFVVAKVVS